MKMSKRTARALIATLAFALISAGLVYASRDWRSERGLTLAQIFPKKLEGDEAIAKELETALKSANAKKAQLEASVAALDADVRSIRSELSGKLKSFSDSERAEVLEILRTNKLPTSYNARVDVARMMVKYNQGANEERKLSEQRARLNELTSQIERAQKEHESALNRIEVAKLLGEANAQRSESGATADFDKCVDELKALTEETSQSIVQDQESTPLAPSDVADASAADQASEAFLSSVVEEANGTLQEEPPAPPATQATSSSSNGDKSQSDLCFQIVMWTHFIALLFGVVLIVMLIYSPKPDYDDERYYIEGQSAKPTLSKIIILTLALFLGAAVGGPFGAVVGLTLGFLNWHWKLGLRLVKLAALALFGGVAGIVGLLALLVLMIKGCGY